MTPAGRRLMRGLTKVLADIRGKRPLLVLAVIPEAIDARAVRRQAGLGQTSFTARFGINRRTFRIGSKAGTASIRWRACCSRSWRESWKP